MVSLLLTVNAFHNAKMEFHGKFGHTLGRIQHIALMSRIESCYATYCIATQTIAPALTGFQGINHCVKYLDSHPHKPILYPYNYYDGPNVTRLTCIVNKLEDHTT